MTTLTENHVQALVDAVLAELREPLTAAAPLADAEISAPLADAEISAPPSAGVPAEPPPQNSADELCIDLPDPTRPEERRRLGVRNPIDPNGLANLAATTTARVAVGRAGPRPTTRALLLFQADHGVTQDAIYGTVPEEVKQQFSLFSVRTQVNDRGEYLLRPDLGRLLSSAAREEIGKRCVAHPQVQIVVGDGLSAAAVTNNLAKILPVLQQGLQAAGLTVGTPFFIEFCRVGVMNDLNEVIGADAVVLLLGERPGLGVADAMSAYMGFQPRSGKTDADRDVICMITENGGTNPLEAGAYVVEHVKKMLRTQASGVVLKLSETHE